MATAYTHAVVDGDWEVYARGETCEAAIRNLIALYGPGDFECETWDEVVSEWERSEDGLGDLMVVKIEDHSELSHAPHS